jgi:tripartite-type tricarboxylate transporter receptor subunit TctC
VNIASEFVRPFDPPGSAKEMPKLARRRFLPLAAAALAWPADLRFARAESYPSRSVRIIVGFPPGGTADIAARLMGQWLSERLGQQFVIENRPGASTNLATEMVAHAPGDGYTLLAVTATNTINPGLFHDLNFDFVRDIAMVGGITRNPLILEVYPSFPAHTVPEFIDYARANPGKITLASPGTGTIPNVAGELFKMKTNTNMLDIPYRGSTPMLTDLLAGRVEAAFDALASVAYFKSGALRVLGVTTTTRSAALPDVPTIGEFLPGFEASGLTAIGVPRQTPAEIVQKLNETISTGLQEPRIESALAEFGGDVLSGSPAELDKLVVADVAKWDEVIKFANLKAD